MSEYRVSQSRKTKSVNSRYLLPKLMITAVSQFIYPIIFISPALFNSTGTYMSIPNSNGGSDILGGVRMAQVMQYMDGMSLDSLWTAYPSGENLWPIQSLTQLFPNMLLAMLSQFFDAFTAVNLLIVIAWAFTGIASLILLRTLGAGFITALIGGVLIQAQPSVQFAATSVISLLFLGFPLLICAIMFKAARVFDAKTTNYALLILIISAFTDGYIYYFGYVCFSTMLISIAIASGLKSITDVRVLLTKLTTGALPIIAAYLFSYGQTPKQDLSRVLTPPSLDILNANGLTPFDYLRPHAESARVKFSCGSLCTEPFFRSSVSNFGLTLFLALIFALFWVTLRKKWTYDLSVLTLVTFIIFLLSLRMTFIVGGFNLFNPSFLLVPLFPGALYLDRFGILACTLCIVVTLSIFSKAISSTAHKKILYMVVLIATSANLIDQNPFGTREMSVEYKSYEQIVNVLSLGNSNAVIFSPYTFHGRRWLQQAYISLPMGNSLFNPSLNALPELTDLSNAKSVACTLRNNGITHLISESGSNTGAENSYAVVVKDSRFFTLRASSQVPAYEAGTTQLDIFEIKCRN